MKKIFTLHKFFFTCICNILSPLGRGSQLVGLLFFFTVTSTTLIISTQKSSALDYHFTAAINNNYNNVGNWTIGYHGSTATVLPHDTDNIVLGDTTADFVLSVNISDTINNLTIEGSGEIFINLGTLSAKLYVKGDLTSSNDNTTGGGNGWIVICGNSNANIYGNTDLPYVGKLPNLIIDKGSATLFLNDFITMGGSTLLAYTSGTIDASHSTVIFYYNNSIKGSFNFFNIEIAGTGGVFKLYSNQVVNGDIYFSGGYPLALDSLQINLYGNIYNENKSKGILKIPSTTLLNFVSDNEQAIFCNDVSPGIGLLPSIALNKTGGDFSLNGTVSICGDWTNNFSYEAVNPKESILYFHKPKGTVSIGGSYSTPSSILVFGGRDSCTINLQIDSAFVVNRIFILQDQGLSRINNHSLKIKGNIITSYLSHDAIITSTIIMEGETDQIFSGSHDLVFSNLLVNKSAGSFFLGPTLTVTNNLDLASGNIITTDTSMLLMTDNATVSHGGSSSYVEGRFSKTGNDAFTYPLGAYSMYKPISISAPSSTSDAFIAKYFTSSVHTDTFSSNLTFVDECEYWNLDHTTGSSNINITLGWDDPCFYIPSLSYLKISRDSSNIWTSAGNVSTSGTTTTGSVTSTSLRSTWGKVSLAKNNVLVIANAGRDTSLCPGQSVTLGSSPTGSGGTGTKTYSWSPSTGLNSSTAANPVATITDTAIYTLTITDAITEYAVDTVYIYVADTIIADAGGDRSICGSKQIYLGNNPSCSGGAYPCTYEWKILGSSLFSTEQNPNVSVTANTDYELKVTDGAGCIDRDTLSITLNSIPISDAGSNITIMPGETATLGGSPTASGGSGHYIYSWSDDYALSSATVSNPMSTPEFTTFYELQLTDSITGCGTSSTISVTIGFPELNFAQDFVLLAKDSLIAIDSVFVSEGKSGAKIFIGSKLISADSILFNTSVVSAAIVNLDTAINRGARISGRTISDLNVQDTLYSGVFSISGSAHLDTLTLMGDESSYFLFNISDTLFASSYSTLLTTKVNPGNIWFNVQGPVIFSNDVNASGVYLSKSSITVNENNGSYRLLSKTKIRFTSRNNLSAPPQAAAGSVPCQSMYPNLDMDHSIEPDFLGVSTVKIGPYGNVPPNFNGGYNNQSFINEIPKLNLSNLIFNEPDDATYMDWNTMWFMGGPFKDYHLVHQVLGASSLINEPDQYDCFPPDLNYGNVWPVGQWSGISNQCAHFQEAVGGSNVNPMFVMNYKTTNLNFNMLYLKHASQMGMPVKYIVLGDEPWNPGDEKMNMCVFPNGRDYMDFANNILDYVHAGTANGLPNGIKVALASPDYRYHSDDQVYDTYCRENTWNASMGLPGYCSSCPTALHLSDGDALHFHVVGKSGMTMGNAANEYQPLLSEAPLLFEKALSTARDFSQSNKLYLPDPSTGPDVNMWVTAGLLIESGDGSGGNLALSGTWAQGLYLAIKTLAYLEEQTISHANPANLIGNADRAELFSDEGGLYNLDQGPNGLIAPPLVNTGGNISSFPSLTNLNTSPYEKTSIGHTLSLIGIAMKGATNAKNIVFNSNSKLYGWIFDNDPDQAIIVNMCNQPRFINAAAIGNANLLGSSDISYEEYYPGTNSNSNNGADPFGYIVGDDLQTYFDGTSVYHAPTPLNHIYETPQTSGGLQVIWLRPYSITRVYVNHTIVTASTDKDKICNNGSTNLHAIGADYYEWSLNTSSSSITGTTHTYSMHPSVTNSNCEVGFYPNGSYGTFVFEVQGFVNGTAVVGTLPSVTITVYDTLTITTTPVPPPAFQNYCGNTPVTLTASLASGTNRNFWWAPLYGLYSTNSNYNSSTVNGNISGSTSTVYVRKNSGTGNYKYQVTGTYTNNTITCFSRDNDFANVKPAEFVFKLRKGHTEVTSMCPQDPSYYLYAYDNTNHLLAPSSQVTWSNGNGITYTGNPLFFDQTGSTGGAGSSAPHPAIPSVSQSWVMNYQPSGGCGGIAVYKLIVKPAPVIFMNRYELCEGEIIRPGNIVHLNNTGADEVYSWSGPLINTGAWGDENKIVSTTSPGTYTVAVNSTYTVTGCSNHNEVQFEVINSDATGVSVPSTVNLLKGCETALTITDVSPYFHSYCWQPGTGLDAITGNSVNASPESNTTYTVSIFNSGVPPSNTYDCCKYLEIEVMVDDIYCQGCNVFCANSGSHTFKVMPHSFLVSNYPLITYKWYKVHSGVATAITGATNYTLTITHPATSSPYDYSAGDQFYCEVINGSCTLIVQPVASVSYACKTEEEYPEEYYEAGLSFSGKLLNIIPNPNNGSFIVQSNDLKGVTAEIEIFDLFSRRIYYLKSATFTSNGALQLKLPENTSDGIYTVRIRNSLLNLSGKVMIYEK